MRKFLAILLASVATLTAIGQDYTFSLQPTAVTPESVETLDNGAVRYVFPAGTDLNSLGLQCQVPQGAVVKPDPASAKIADGQLEVFTVTYADGFSKSFPYYFEAGRWFTAVLLGDPEAVMTTRTGNNSTVENLAAWANGIIGLGNSGHYGFAARPGYKPKADIVICMGDMDQDSEKNCTEIKAFFDKFTAAGIPLITMAGNHDLVPDYWEGGDKGLTWGINDGGAYANKICLQLVEDYIEKAKTLGIEDVKYFTQSNGTTQIKPFSFLFKGVRFFIGQTYWFQKPYDAPGMLSAAKYYAPNGVIEALDDYVSTPEVAATPSVWVQHYPINCEDRWWLDQSSDGSTIEPQDTPAYQSANDKRQKYRDMIAKTKNPVHFSGHNHNESTSTHTSGQVRFTDYVAPYFATRSGAFLVLCHEGEGVVEVQSVCFDY